VTKVFPGVPHLICHFHFLRDVGTALLRPEHEALAHGLKHLRSALAKLRRAVQVQNERLSPVTLAQARGPRLVDLLQAGQPQARELGDAARRDGDSPGGQFHADLLALPQFDVAQTHDLGDGVVAEGHSRGCHRHQFGRVQIAKRGAPAAVLHGQEFFPPAPKRRRSSATCAVQVFSPRRSSDSATLFGGGGSA
jgi:hypothetical protein